ncbi:MAG: dihydrodipicolinate synthase family protein [Chloroflexota bacterium]|nr:MAG: dihydrodipicolinate synthase family protein [Chloroflexota bacterium]
MNAGAHSDSSVQYAGAWPVLLTPFHEDQSIDWSTYEAVLEWYIDRGVGGLFAVCLSGEMFELTAEERFMLARTAVRVAGNRVPVVATGNFGDDLAGHIDSVKRTADSGVSAVVLVLPTFARTDRELLDYFDTLIAQTSCSCGLYECPVPERRLLSPAVVKHVAESGRFVCFKETCCDPSILAAKCAAAAGTNLAILQANTPLILEARRLGCTGSMCISANVAPELVHSVLEAPDGDAEELHQRLCVVESLIRHCHPAGSKFLLGERGLPITMAGRAKRDALDLESQAMMRQAWRFLRSAMDSSASSFRWRE